MSPPTAMSPAWPVHRAPGRWRTEAPAGRVNPALASGGQSPWRYLPHRARSSATAPGVAGRRGSGLRQRPYRSPALSLGLLKTKKSPRQGARRAYCATGTAVCVTGTSVRSACVPPWFITVCTVSVMNISWPFTAIAALSRIRAFG